MEMIRPSNASDLAEALTAAATSGATIALRGAGSKDAMGGPVPDAQADLAELAQHKYGYRVVVQLLHPKSGRYLPPQLLAIAQPPPKEYSAEAMQRGGGGAAAATDAAVDETKPQKKKKKQEQKEAAAEGNDSDEEGEVRGALAGSVLVRLAL